MAAKGEATSAGRPILLVGSGRRPREIGAVLGALATVRAPNGKALEPLRPHGLEDVEELLSRGPGDGTLILEYGRVPGEDIGFVRRFLERHPGWRLIVVGEDHKHPVARGLLALPRSQWLPWPPDLDVLGALLTSSPTPQKPPPPPARARKAKPSAPAPAPPAKAGTSPPATGEAVDVGSLLEELLAGAALAGEGAPRYLFRCDGPVHLAWERGPLAEVLLGLLALARRCAGSEGVVSARVDPPEADAERPVVLLRIDFPAGPLADADLGQLLEGDFDGDPALAREIEAARSASGLLRSLGGEARLTPHPPERLRFELELPDRAPAEVDPPGPPPDRGSPEDPFA